MSAQARHILVTGSNGFIGRHLVSALLQAPDFHDCRFTFLDFTSDGTVSDPRGRVIAGDFGDRDMISDAIDGRADVVLHLAGILGGAAEANYALSRKVNIEGTLNLFEALRDADNSPRVVFASSIAVFGTDIPPAIDDDTIPQPSMIYGAQKRMMEVAVEHFSARGWIDGFAIRLPGIVARRDADARIKSAFLNQLFFAFEAGRDIELPVSPHGTTWLISVDACAEAFLHAARIPAGTAVSRRAFTLPAQRVNIAQLVSALAEHFPDSATQVSYAVDPALDQQFARQPALTTRIADELGFRHDGDVATLVRKAISA